MASIEYGIDSYGRKVYANKAYSGCTYKCPYCPEEIHVCKGNIREDYFAHNPISNRTPQQMICPGYTGKGVYRRIENDIDQVYITNGGIPLYICERGEGKYQLNAYFPPLSKSSMDLLKAWDVTVEIMENGIKEEHSASNINFYKLKTLAKWIYIKCKNMKYSIPEIKQKWEWGIQGLNIENDIFHSNYGGGYRVALHSNIVVKKEYLFIANYTLIPNIRGITFCKKGNLILNNLYNGKRYNIYSMVVNELTEKAIAFVQNKGYQLIEKNDEIIPMWPPAVIEGKELIYRKSDSKAYLYHNKHSEQKLFYFNESGLSRIEESDNIFIADTNNITILLSDQFNRFSNEIRFILTKSRDNFNNKEAIAPNIKWIDDNAVTTSLSEDGKELFGKKKVYLEADVDFVVCILSNNLVEKSTRRTIENIRRNRKIIISIEPFGKLIYENRKTDKKVDVYKSDLDINLILKELYRCDSARIPINIEFKDVYEFAKNNSYELFRIMEYWAIKNEMPYAAIKYLYQIKEAIKNE